MNTAEKAQAYDEMVQRVKELHEAGNALTKKQMEIVLPELAESEDERIRTRLLEYFHGFKDSVECPVFWEGLNIDNILTWLEKQKDHFREDTKMVEQTPAEWSEKDEEMYARIVRRYTDYEGVIMRTKEESVADKMLNAMAQEEIWLKSLRPSWKLSEQEKGALLMSPEETDVARKKEESK